MATGLSLHVGVNVTEAPGIDAPLVGCENDARKMLEIATARGFIHLGDDPAKPIIGSDATYKNVLGKIRIAADKLEAGDIFLFTFSGHGTQQGDEDPEERDLQDETLVLHDRLLIDNVLRRLLWPTFKPGVRVVMVSDSCHSGGAAMSVVDSEIENNGNGSNGNQYRVRAISPGQAQSHLELLKDFYNELKKDLPEEPPPVNADFLLLAACGERERTRDGNPHGVFTQALLDVWNTNGSKTYQQLMDGISQKLTERDVPSRPVMMSIHESSQLKETEAFRI